VNASSRTTQDRADGRHTLALEIDGFVWDSLHEECARAGLTTGEMIAFCVLYYLADADSGRIARRISASPYRVPAQEQKRH
jgi:hypothetical protein